jgi:DNA-binding NarL/FixJ family response regulator
MYEGSARRAVVVLDEHPLWLDAMEGLLDRMGLDVVGKTTGPGAALALVGEHQPDVFVASLNPSDSELDGLSCVRRVRTEHPDVIVVVLASTDDQDQIDAAFSAGAAVYCVKTAQPQDLVAAIRQSFEHSIYFAGAPRTPEQPTAPRRQPDTADLTKRELEILTLVAEGHSNSQLAQMLWVTEQTVKFHLSNIYRKLNVANRTEASRWAQLHGLLANELQSSAA